MGSATKVDEVQEVREATFKVLDERPWSERHEVGLKVVGVTIGLAVGVGVVALGLWAGWVVSGIVAIKLGLLGFWWHLLSYLVVGGFITGPVLAIAKLIFGAVFGTL